MQQTQPVWKEWKDALILMRIPFSIYLMPVFWFAFSNNTSTNLWNATLVFIVWHLLVYPASNGYNSYYDKDDTPVGGLLAPPKVNTNLIYLVWIFDVLALLVASRLNLTFVVAVWIYLIVSKAYSHPAIRLKSMPILGTFTVIFFQGFFTYTGTLLGFGLNISDALMTDNFMCASVSSLFLLGSYPLTQVYQHQEDKARGDITLSVLLGVNGTFLFAAINLLFGASLLCYYFFLKQDVISTALFIVCTGPVVYYFLKWWSACRKNLSNANHNKTMKMNKISSLSLTFAFVLMAVVRSLGW